MTMEREIRIVDNHPDKTKKRIGVIAPNAGRVNEVEFPLVLPEEISTLITCLSIGQVDGENVQRVLSPPLIEDAAKALADAGADVIFQMGVPLMSFMGYGIDQVIIDRIQKATNRPAYTMTLSVVDSLRSLGVKNPVVVTPYRENFNAKVKRYLEDHGFRVPCIESFEGGKITATGNVSPDGVSVNFQPAEVAYQLAKRVFAKASGGDGLFISCGGFRTVTMISRLEEELGVPVTSAAYAVIWKALSMLGYDKPIKGFGQLLENKLP